jgi:hypothetical protein
MTQGIDKRRFERYDLRLPVLYKRLGAGLGKAGIGWTRNLSMGGVCVDLDERLDLKMFLGVLFQTDHGPIEVEAEVAWAASAPGIDGGIGHGLEFRGLGPKQTQAMERLLAEIQPTVRTGHRLALDIGVTVIPRDRPGEVISGRTGNASRGGALLLLPQALGPGTLLTVRLQTSREPLRLDAAVIWVDPPEKRQPGKAIRHGVQFVSLDWSTSLALGLLLTGAA